MVLITVFLLLGPAVVAWKIAGDCGLDSAQGICRMILSVLFNGFAVLLGTYFVINAASGDMVVNLSGSYVEAAWSGIFHINFVWKYGVISLAFAVILGIAERVFFKATAKRRDR